MHADAVTGRAPVSLSSAPVAPLVETTRGGIVESVHFGALAVADASADVRWSLGDPDLVAFPRSSWKPFQLQALVERGGVERFGFSEPEVAVMAASHSGEPMHVAAVQGILRKIDAPPAALACGAHAPMLLEAAIALEAAGESPTALHNNCSGKHSGMLALARLLGAPLPGYLDPGHPAQRAIREGIGGVLEIDADALTVGVDGCGAPAYATSLRRMAVAAARLARPELAPTPWRAALTRVADAMRARPEIVGGSRGRVDTDLMRLGRGLVAKAGAEGYMIVGHPNGLGLALKVSDGDAAKRAVPVALLAALRRLGWIDDADFAGPLAAWGPTTPVANWAGTHVGDVRPAF